MKVTPLILFLILIFILVLSIIFSKYLPLYEWTEGFINFSNNKQPIDFVQIDRYSPNSQSVVRLYDNLFFDTVNGNIIEVDGPSYQITDMSGVGDISGNRINQIFVTTRDGKTSPAYDSNSRTVVEESKVSEVLSSYGNWVYNSRTTTTDKYQVMYFSWDKETYIHVIKLGTNPSHIASFHFTPNNIMDMFSYPNNLSVNVGNGPSGAYNINPGLVLDTTYNSQDKIYQIANTVKYDLKNANLIIDNSSNITVYNRYGNPIQDYINNRKSSIANTEFNPFIVNDLDNNMILYMPYLTNTVVAVIQLNTDNTFKIGTVSKFNKNEVVLEKEKPKEKPKEDIPTVDKSPHSDYYKWLAYWNTIANVPPNYSDDYLLKTQIVPPVCPTCPSCPSIPAGSVCSNCGGQGGCGTKTNTGESIVMGTQTGSGDRQTLSGNIVSGVENVAGTGAGVINNTVNTAGNLIAGGGLEAGALLAGGALVTSDLLKSAGSGAVDLAKSTGSGAVDLLKSTGSGAVNLLNDNRQRPYGGQYQGGQYGGQTQGGQYGGQTQGGQYGGQTQGGQSPGVDNYSYYGALPPKQSNFIPITTDFSAFSK